MPAIDATMTLYSFFRCFYSKLRMLPLLLVFFVSISSNKVNPSRLLVSTVVDPTSELIIRDALTLLRSARLFGGSLNEATFMVCIPVENNAPYVDTTGLLLVLSSLDVEISFVSQTQHPLPKTLNKFMYQLL